MSNARQLAANLPREGGLSNRNLIINGAMQVWQRGTSSTSSGALVSVDRFYSINTNKFNRSTDTPDGFRYSLLLGNSTATYPYADQRVEASTMKQTEGKPLTISFWAKATSSTPNIFAELVSPSAEDNFTTQTIRFHYTWSSPSSSWTYYTATYTAPHTELLNGASVRIGLQNQGAGDLYLTGVQLEVGDTATPFEHRSYGDELARCQRYYETSGIGDGGNYEHQRIQSNSAIPFTMPPVSYKVTKRTTPTVTIYGASGVSGKISVMGTNYDYSGVYQSGTDQFALYDDIPAGWLGYFLEYDWVADAEL